MENAVGLVITGGGARGAYQAGVLKRIGKLKSARTEGNPFPIIGGASAGAINGAALATGCGDFALATQRIAEAWATLKPSEIFHCG
ncbi:MAG: patatin-like phospholipase family protein, partial [Candidatus Sulfotelmatobacter sp.]